MAVSESLANYLLSSIEGSRFEVLVQRLLGILQPDQGISNGFQLPTTGTPGGGPSIPVDLGPSFATSLQDVVGDLPDLTAESNRYLAGILDTLVSFQPFGAPAGLVTAAGTSTAGLGMVTFGHITINVNAANLGSDPAALARTIATQVMDQIEQQLAQNKLIAGGRKGSAVRT